MSSAQGSEKARR
ncbi:hypothetical protein CIB84_012999 [Bambusicola thoracicus]|uniref:Uncharacterized protein n=1 Tax=Bambusicola thoracicus TaxID=9083 RepID=A0A2P4SGM8_BAMTH|nr:hypothetical protein CIB84_012999 [Bambusicola thoracicus]